MTERAPEDFAHERTALDSAHQQNETQRDSFIALAHTALFAASVSFVGNVTPLRTAIWRPVLITGWTSSIIGLLALTLSFHFARQAIDARRAALNDDDPPASRTLEALNAISLWSFPISLLCLFSFVTANVVSAHEPSSESPVSAQPTLPPGRGCLPAAPRTDACACTAPTKPAAVADPQRTRRARAGRRDSRTSGADANANPATTASATREEVTLRQQPKRRCY